MCIGGSVLLLLSYGLIADVWLTRYRMVQLSILMNVFVSIVALICGMASMAFPHLYQKYSVLLVYPIVIIEVITSIGIFEANALQIGMDQLLEASSAQLSALSIGTFGQPILDSN